MDSSLLPVLLGAVSMASQVFGPWQPITVQDIKKDVPEFVYQVSTLGSVQRFEKSEIVGCPVKQNGKTVGWSLACN